MPHVRSQRGFTIIELLAVLGIVAVLAAVTVPATASAVADARLRGDARSVHNALGLTKMRAAARYTRERLYVDLTTNRFHLEFWDKTNSRWAAEAGITNLSSGVAFGFGALSTPPPNTQTTIGQAAQCRDNANNPISGTACIVFNSRGIPVDSSGSPTGGNAIYITDGVATYGVTMSATPLVRLWWTPATSAHWVHR